MKKHFLIFILVSVLFSGCVVNREKTRTMTGTLRDIIGTFELSSGIKGKLLTWKDFNDPAKWYEETVHSVIWPVYPADIVSKDMIGSKVRVTYQITETVQSAGGIEGVLLIRVKKIEVLKKA